jgi:hypothetical protein
MNNDIQYNQNFPINGDHILQLPVDKNIPMPNEVHIIDTLFKKNRGAMNIIFEEAKDSIIVVLLIIASCLPQINEAFQKFLPITQNSPYFLFVGKGLLFGLLFWLIKHFYLSRKG